MLRMYDWRCHLCHRVWEEMVRVEDNLNPWCCGTPATKIWRTPPPLNIKSGYNASMGKHFTSAREFEKALKNMGCHVADKAEIEASMHPSDHKPKQPDPEPIKAATEKAWSQLHTEGLI